MLFSFINDCIFWSKLSLFMITIALLLSAFTIVLLLRFNSAFSVFAVYCCLLCRMLCILLSFMALIF